MTIKNYQISALSANDLGGFAKSGLHFTMPGSTDTHVSVADDDNHLSGGRYGSSYDSHGQAATITFDGADTGSTCRIFIDKIFGVTGSDGCYYELVVLKQEYTGKLIYTFNEAHGVPSAGVQLTLGHSWSSGGINYSDLGAGPISTAAGLIVIEAEDFDLHNMQVRHGSNASNGDLVRTGDIGGSGSLSTTFQGAAGVYDLTVFAQDETDGVSTIKVKINDDVVGTIKLDRQTDGHGSDHGHFSEFDLSSLTLKPGDDLQLLVQGDHGEWARIDKVELERTDGAPTGPGHGPNLLINGDFEDNILNDKGSSLGLHDALSSGWQDLGHAPAQVHEENFGHGNEIGDAIVELECGVRIAQTVDLPEAGAYTLEFDVTRRGSSDQDNTFQLIVNGDLIETIVATGSETLTFNFNLPAGPATIEFKSLSHTYKGAGLDDVSFKQDFPGTTPGEPSIAKIDFEKFDRGDVVNQLDDNVSVTVKKTIHTFFGDRSVAGDAMIFDSDNPSGGDHDLGNNGQGNILIISEDGDAHDPDDNAAGGLATFTFEQPTTVTSITVIDFEEGGKIVLFDEHGALIKTINIPCAHDGDVDKIAINTDGVSKMKVVFKGSGAIDDIHYIVPGGDNDAPVATDDVFATDEATPVTGNLIADDNGNGIDSDPDGDALSVAATSLGAVGAVLAVTSDGGRGGELLVNPDGSYSFTPGDDFIALGLGESDTLTFTYTITDGNGGEDTATVVITIDGINEAPVAADDAITTDEDTAVSGSLLDDNGNGPDADDNGDPLTVAAVSFGEVGEPTPVTSDGGRGGDLVVNPDGTFTFTPGDDFNDLPVGESDTVTFTYTIDDGNGGTDTATVTITVDGANDAPIATDNTNATDEDTAVSGNLLGDDDGNGIDSDPDGDVLTVVTTSLGAIGETLAVTSDGGLGGELLVGADGAYTFTPGDDFDALAVGDTDTLTFTYTIADGNGGEDTATVVITVTGTNDAPVVADDAIAAGEDAPVSGTLFGDNGNGPDVDPDGDPLTVAAVSFGEVGEPTPVTSDGGRGGDLVVNPDGTFTFTPGDDFATLPAGETDTVTFTYTVDDGNGGTDTATVTITVGGDNDAPVATDDVFATDEATPVTGNLIADDNGNGIDSDPDGDALSVAATSLGAVGAVLAVTSDGGRGGELLVNPDGSYSFTPGDDFIALGLGESDTLTFTYTITDGNGGEDTATVVITIDGINEAPVAADDAITTDEDTAVSGSLLDDNGNGPDADDNGDPLTVAAVSFGEVGEPTPVTSDGGRGGDLVVNPDGTFTFTPGDDFNDLPVGESDTVTFTYTIDDGNGGTDTATVTITVDGANDAPIATDNTNATDEDTAVSGNLLGDDDGNGIDSDPDGDVLTVVTTSLGAIGETLAVTSDGGLGGELLVGADGAYTFTPGDDFDALAVGDTDTLTFTYTIADGNGGEDTATVVITVTGTNDAPVVADDAIAAGEDAPVSGTLFGDNGNGPDVDPDGDPLTVAAVSFGEVGEPTPVTSDGGRGGDLVVNPDGTFTFTPGDDFATLPAGETDTVTFTYTVDDGNGGTDTATVTITVGGDNDAPVATDDVFATDEATPVTGNLIADDNGNGIDSDPDGDALSVAATSLGAVGAVLAVTSDGGRGGELLVNPDGSYSFTPGDDFIALGLGESDTLTFTYTITDGNGGEDTATVVITIDGINEAPVAADDAITTDEDTAVSGSLLDDNGNGPDADDNGDPLTVAAVSFGEVGEPTPVTSDGGRGGDLVVNPDGTFTFTPGDDFNDLPVGESDTVTFTYTIDDGNGGTDTATVTITVDGANDAPIATDNTNATDEDTAVSGNLLGDDDGNGIDSDPDGDVLTVVTTSLGAIGETLAVTSDGGLGGELLVGADGAYTFTPGDDFDALAVGDTDTLTFTYTIADGNGGEDTATVVITVTGTNDAPVVADDAIAAGEDAPVSGTLFGDNGNGPDVDPDGDPLTVAAVSFGEVGEPTPVTSDGGRGGDLVVNPDGTFTFTPGDDFATLPAGETDTVTFTYTVDDGNGGTDTATVTITVGGDNDAPVATDDVFATDEATPVTGNLIADDNGNGIDSDPDGDALSVAATSLGAVGAVLAVTSDGGRGGELLVNPDGSYSFTPGDDFIALGLGESDTLTFTYTITDGNGGEDTATVVITIDGINEAPVAADDAITTDEDTAVSGSLLDDNGNGPDADDNGDPLTVAAVSFGEVGEPTPVTSDGGRGGDLVVNPDGTFTFTPGDDFNDLPVGESDTVTFTYTIDDGNGGTDTATVTITVDGANDAPIATDNTNATDEDTAVSGNLLGDDDGNGIDSDPDGDVLTVVTTSLGAIGETLAVTSDGGLGGELLVGADGAYTFTPGDDFDALAVGDTDTLTFTYTIADGNGGEDTATVVITVTGTNDAPVVADDAIAAGEDAPVSGTLFGDNGNGPDVDPDGDPLTVAAVSFGEVGEPTPVTSDGGRGGDLVVNPDGTFTFTPGDDFATLPAGETDTVTFTYTVDDGNGGTDTATVTITVGGDNDAPVATDDVFATDEATPVTGNLIADDNGNGIDSDPDGDALSVAATSLGAVGAVLAVTSDGGRGGELLVNPDGSYSFTPGDDFIALGLGESDTLTFTYTITDGNGGEDTATVVITIDGINEAPVAADDAITTDEDTAVSGSLLDDNGNGPDADDNGDPLTVAAVSFGEVGEPTPVTSDGGRGGDLVVNPDGTFTFTPGDDFNDLPVGESDTVTFTYTIDDGNGGTDTATVTITVDGANDAPIATDNTNATDEDTAVSGNLLGDDDGNGIDSDPDGDVLTVVTTSLGAIGETLAVTSDGGLGGELLVGADGAYTFTPGDDFDALAVGDTDTLTFTYTIADGNGGEDTATVVITVTGTNDAPVVADDAIAAGEDAPVSGTLFGDNGNGPDVDPDGDPLTVAAVSFGEVGEPTPVTSDGGRGGDLVVNPDGTFTFTPGDDFATLPAGETDTVTFTYTVDDGNGGTDTATVTITVGGDNDAPVATDDVFATDEATPVTGNLIADDNGNGIDSDPDGDALSVAATSLGAVGAVLAVTSDGGRGGELLVNPDGSYSFTPGDDFIALGLGESDTLTFTYTITDGNGGEDTATVVITIDGINEAPVAADDAITTDEDTAVSGSLLDDNGNGPDADDNGDPLTVAAVSFGEVGEPTPVTSDGGRGGDLVVNPDGTFTFTPGDDFNDLPVGESDTVTFTYTIDDGNGGTDTATVTITVDGANDAPIATDNTNATDEDTAVSGNLLGDDDGNGIDSDPDGDVLTVVTTSLGAIGETLAVTSDGGLGGELLVGADGAYTFTPGDDFDALAVGDTDTLTFTYTIADGNGGEDTATVVITVTGTNDAPVVADDAIAAGEDAPVSGTLFGDNGNGPDVDPDGDPLTVAAVSFGEVGEPTPVTSDGGRGGDLVVNPDGTFTFTPGDDFATLPAGETDTVTFTYTVDDGNGGTDTATVTITVGGDNDAPVATDDVFATDEATPVTGNLIADDNGNGIDSDPDGDALSVAATSLGAVGAVLAVTSDGGRGGELLVNPDGSYSFTPGDDFIALGLGESDTLTFTYTITDGNGGEDTATVVITIDGINEAPVAADDAITTDEDTAVSGSLLDDNGNGPDADDNGDPLTVAAVSFGEVGEPTPVTSDGGRGGDLVVNPDGTFTFTPGDDFNDLPVGESDTVTFTYTIDDGNGGTDTATVTITVDGANDAPIATDNTNSTSETTPVSGNLITDDDGNGIDSDPDGDNLTVVTTSLGAVGDVLFATSAAGRQGTITISPDGAYTFTPGTEFIELAAGDTDTVTFTYTIADGNGGEDTAEAVITLIGFNDAPVATDDIITTPEDVIATGNLITEDTGAGIDSDPNDDPLIVTALSFGDVGDATTVTSDGGRDGELTVNSDGSYSFEPGPDFVTLPVGELDTLTFTYTISDGNGGSDTANVTINIGGQNADPIARTNVISINEEDQLGLMAGENDDGSDIIVFNLLTDPIADSDPDGDPLTVISVTAENEVSGVETPFTVITDNGIEVEVIVQADGRVLFDTGDQFVNLTEGISDSFSFEYTISDGNGGTSTSQATVNINGLGEVIPETSLNLVFLVDASAAALEANGSAGFFDSIDPNDPDFTVPTIDLNGNTVVDRDIDDDNVNNDADPSNDDPADEQGLATQLDAQLFAIQQISNELAASGESDIEFSIVLDDGSDFGTIFAGTDGDNVFAAGEDLISQFADQINFAGSIESTKLDNTLGTARLALDLLRSNDQGDSENKIVLMTTGDPSTDGSVIDLFNAFNGIGNGLADLEADTLIFGDDEAPSMTLGMLVNNTPEFTPIETIDDGDALREYLTTFTDDLIS